ncbi:MFS transporter [Candidatus Nephthysia bennettiae]|uniref:MFS transporter n=1 Tax=Candidatus Nephthysia bennettiae TaxID=3127016 RepID=A0A934KCB8_9BACT|nr:MFS transporter [Candidatus Dormibacteraeota bacterium]MBJ7612410.1 MFS transporter [Candidatus Dormibacteraeota bacterium]
MIEAAPDQAVAAVAPVDWKRNLTAIAVSQFATKFGFAFATPFVPLFLSRELGIRNGRELAFWAGLVAGATGLGVATASPVWGAVADRYGRKRMLVRAMIGGGVILAATAFVRTPPQLVGVRFFLGAMAGTTAAATALVAAETPRGRVGWALGTVSSTQALGQAFGPLAGGLLSAVFGLRQVLVAGGLLIIAPVLMLARAVRETPRPELRSRRSIRQVLHDTEPAVRIAVGVLVVAQGLTYFGYWSAVQLAAVRLVELNPRGAAVETGFAFTALGLATGAAALGYSFVATRIGFRAVGIGAAVVMAVMIGGIGRAPAALLVIAAVGGMGLAYGALAPALSSMVGLEAPSAIKATVFGLSASVSALGMASGPIITGGVAALVDVPAALLVSAGATFLSAVMLAGWAREPR